MYITLVIAAALVVCLGTGWWRVGFTPFAIPARKMTVERLGLCVAGPEDAKRVNGILASFAGGFNAMITAPRMKAVRAHCESIGPLYRSFAEEGMAMGYTLRRLFRYDPASFESQIIEQGPGFRYLYYVGLGFWSGIRNHSGQRLTGITQGLDPLHRFLCFDGYGFNYAFFEYGKDPEVLRRLDGLDGYARHAAYQGVGRAFWFLFSGDPERLIEHAARFGEYSGDIAAGVGLASVFVNPDRLDTARDLANKMPQEWHDDFHLGMCFGLKARSINDPDEYARNLGLLDAGGREAVTASIRECDRVEAAVRGEMGEDGYRRWREQVTAWMASNVSYPLTGVATTSPSASGLPTAVETA